MAFGRPAFVARIVAVPVVERRTIVGNHFQLVESEIDGFPATSGADDG